MARRTVTESGVYTYIDDVTVGSSVISATTFTDEDTTPSVPGKYFKTANTSSTTITDFDDASGDFHHIVIYINDAYTTIAHDATKIDMPGGVSQTFLAGDVIEGISIGGVWKMWNSRTD